MDSLSFILLGDGPTDRALEPILTWLLRQHLPFLPIQARWVDLRRLPNPPKKLHDRIEAAIDLYSPCDLVFVHRDAEAIPLDERQAEIMDAVQLLSSREDIPPVAPVVPVRMTEAWLLSDRAVIREAAGNPNGSTTLPLPRPVDIESLPDPKATLRKLILAATELSIRRKRRFDVTSAVLRIPEYTEDFSRLRQLNAFIALERRLAKLIRERGWTG